MTRPNTPTTRPSADPAHQANPLVTFREPEGQLGYDDDENQQIVQAVGDLDDDGCDHVGALLGILLREGILADHNHGQRRVGVVEEREKVVEVWGKALLGHKSRIDHSICGDTLIICSREAGTRRTDANDGTFDPIAKRMKDSEHRFSVIPLCELLRLGDGDGRGRNKRETDEPGGGKGKESREGT